MDGAELEDGAVAHHSSEAGRYFTLLVAPLVYLGHPPGSGRLSPTCCLLCLPHAPPPPRPVIPERVTDNGRRAGKWTSGTPVPRTATSALLCSVRVQIWCVMIWQSGVAELGIAGTRSPARRPTGRPDGRRRSALNSSSSAVTLLLACFSFLMNSCFE